MSDITQATSNIAQAVLSLDTALGPICVGVNNPKTNLVSYIVIEREREQAQILVPTVQAVMEHAGLEFENLDQIMVTVGPGSFTGLRISLATARTFGLAINCPVTGITTLDGIAYEAQSRIKAQPFLVVLETKRQDFYACLYDENGQKLFEPCAQNADDIFKAIPESIGAFPIVGNAVDRFCDCLNSNYKSKVYERITLSHISPQSVINLSGLSLYHQAPAPVYLRDADISKPKRKQRELVS